MSPWKPIAAICLLLAGRTQAQRAYTVGFESLQYASTEGSIFTAPINITPPPANGLFSYGLVVEVAGNSGYAGVVLVQPSTTLAFDGIRGPGTQRGDETGISRGKGTANALDSSKPTNSGTTIATVSLSGLPAGTYTLQLAPYYTLGPTESLFIDGAGQPLDPFIAFGNATLNVTPSNPTGTISENGAARIDRQTGLLLRDYTLTNTGNTASAFRIWVKNLASNWQVWNRHGVVNDTPYVDIRQILQPGRSVSFTLEFYASPRIGTPEPTLEAVGITIAPTNTVGQQTSLAPRATLVGGNVLLEFPTEVNKVYTIQYSGNLTDWFTVLPKIQGTGSRVQWIDNGPPKTPSLPAAAGTRFYRMITE